LTANGVEVFVSVYLFVAHPAEIRLAMSTHHFVAALNFTNERMAFGATFRIILNKVMSA